MSIVDVNHDRAHLLGVFADNFLLIRILVQQFGDSDVGAEEVLLDSVDVLVERLRAHWWLFLRGRVLEVAVINMAVARH